MSTTSLNVTDNTGANCGLGHQQQDICEIDCANDGDLRGAPIHCGDAPHCSIHCSVKRCMRESIINATLSDSLYFSATAQECIRDSFIYFPINGNVTFIVDTLGLSGAHGIAKLVELHGESSDRIDILCKDPLHSEASKDDCAGMKIYAQGADFLSVTVSGAEFQTDAQIYCPFHSDLEPSCVVNGTNAHQMTDKVVIHIGNGTVPKDLLWFGGSGDYGSGGTSIKVISSDGTCAINETSKTFENAGPCWKEITAAPTTTNPTTTPSASPTTSSPTTEPTIEPTAATAAPSASPTATTSEPTTSPTDSTSNPTTSPVTAQPSLAPSAATNPPTTSEPTTPEPTTSTTSEQSTAAISTGTTASESSTSTSSTVLQEHEIEESTTYTYETSLFMDEGANSDTVYIIIGVAAGAVVCLLLVIVAFFIGRRSRSKANENNSDDEWMSDNRLAGAVDNELFRSKSAVDAENPNKANVDMVRPKAATYSAAPPIPALPPAPMVTAPQMPQMNTVNSSSYTGYYNNAMPMNYGAPSTFPTNMQFGYNPMMTAQYSGTLSADGGMTTAYTSDTHHYGETTDDPIEVEVQPPVPMIPPAIGVMAPMQPMQEMQPMQPQDEVVDTLTQIIQQHKQRESLQLDQQPELHELTSDLKQDELDDYDDESEDDDDDDDDEDDDDNEDSYDVYTPMPQDAPDEHAE